MSSADNLIASLQSLDASSFPHEADRVRVRDALFAAMRKVQSPWDIAWEHGWVTGVVNAATKTLIDAGVFQKWAEAGGDAITCVKLAELTGADEILIRRLMRTLAGQFLIIEVAQDTYKRTPWAQALVQEPAFCSIYGRFYHEINNPAYRLLPEYLQKTDYKNPTDANNCNFQYWQGPGTDLFQYVGKNPLLASDFSNVMECHSKHNLTPWPDVYPTDTIVAAARPGVPLVVDVGGGKGHDLMKFLKRHPDLPPGSLILQDRPDMIQTAQTSQAAQTNAAIVLQPHDFFQPQPVRGACVYFFHNVLHDWPDATAIKILRALVPSMEKGYSRLLIHESLISNVQPQSRVTVSDITMMAFTAAEERTEEQWKKLIESAGLRLIKLWKPAYSVESILEAEVA